MARFWLVYCTVLVAAGVLLYAQGAAPGSGMAPGSVGMGSGMHPMAAQSGNAGMMEMGHDESPLHRLMMTPYVLPNLKTELSLSSEQSANLDRMKQELKTRNHELSDRIAAKQKEMDAAMAADAISNRGPSRDQLREVATLKADMQFNLVDTAGKMRAALNDTQRTKFAAMTTAEMHHSMMTGSNMQDMHEMMQVMGEMPQGRMMQGHTMMDGKTPGQMPGQMMDHGAMGTGKK